MPILEPVESLMHEGRWAEASSLATELLLTYPANSRLNGYLGLCEFRLGHYSEALEPLSRAVALDPSFVDAGVKLAQAYDRLERNHECAVVAREFLKRRPYDRNLQGLLEAHESELTLDREAWEKSEWIPAHRAKMTNR